MSIDLRSIVVSTQAAHNAQPQLDDLKKATEGFESIFLKKLFSQMRASVKETQFGQTFGKEIYDDMFNGAMADAAAKNRSLGMADMLYRQFAPRLIEAERQRLERASLKPFDGNKDLQPKELAPHSETDNGQVRQHLSNR